MPPAPACPAWPPRSGDPARRARSNRARDRGIRVFTVGFGTAACAMAPVEGYSIFMMFDEETLKAIADLTGAEYFHAGTADELATAAGRSAPPDRALSDNQSNMLMRSMTNGDPGGLKTRCRPSTG